MDVLYILGDGSKWENSTLIKLGGNNMALEKEKILDSGVSGNYWVAEARNNMVDKNTNVIMLLYKDKASRDAGLKFLERQNFGNLEGIYLTGEQVYAAVKASKKQINVLEPAVEEVKGPEGNVIQEAKDAVTEEVETNWFADATDLV